jgi:hypothetical protein
MLRHVFTLPLLLGIFALLTSAPVAAVRQGTPTPGADQFYLADEQGGFDDWSRSELPDWIVRDRHLLNDGTALASAIPAPYELPDGGTDYAVEAEVAVVRCEESSGGNYTPQERSGFGIVVRAEEGGAYWVGYLCGLEAGIWFVSETGSEALATFDQAPTVDAEWRTYRVEVEGLEIRLIVDEVTVVETMDLRLVGPGDVGLFSSEAQVDVRRFAVLPLDGDTGTGTPSTSVAD